METIVNSMLALNNGKILAGTGSQGKIYLLTQDYADVQTRKNVTYRASTLAAYGVDTYKEMAGHFISGIAAMSQATAIIGYMKDIHGELPIEVPLKYYALNITDTVNAEINRSKVSMLGTKKCEITGLTFNLGKPSIGIDLRVV